MASGLLKPLAVFCSQSQSQRYIKSIRNIGDAWRSLAEESLPQLDKNTVLVETNFDFVLKITNGLEQRQTNPAVVEMSTHEPSAATSQPTKPHAPTESPRNYRIFADYGTDFIWRDPHDLRPGEGDCMLDAEEMLSGFPPPLLEFYDAWVETYTHGFSERREKSQNYNATTFSSASEEVAWNVAGFLLAWRIALAPQVGRIEFSAGGAKYMLQKGNETSVTLKFLEDQVDMLTQGRPIA